VSMAQPQKRLAKALLELEPGFTPEFLRNEERKKQRAELVGRRSRDGFYDTSAWSLPLLFGVRALWVEDALSGASLAPVDSATARSGPVASSSDRSAARASYGYLYSAESFDAMRLTAQLLREGFNLAVATEPFRVLDTDFPRGSIIARTERNAETLHQRIAALAAGSMVRVHALQGARVQSGSDFGEDPIVELEAPRIALITDEPTDDRSYGATWFTLEQRLGLGFTALKIEQLRSESLGRYDVIVFPHGSPADYQDALGESGLAKLRRWTQDGGTLVLIKGAAAMATRKGVEWTSSTLKRDEVPVRLFFEGSSTEAPGARAARDTARPAAAPVREMDPVRTPGAILRVRIDPEHFLGFGYSGDAGATIQSNYAFTISRNGYNVAAFPEESSLKLAGFMWPDSRRSLARTLYTWLEPSGSGQVILFADDPNFRATQLSTMRLFFNAVVLGPSFVR
jgi:hypothetical protein